MASNPYFNPTYNMHHNTLTYVPEDAYSHEQDQAMVPRKPNAAFIRPSTLIIHDPENEIYENIRTSDSRSASVFSRPEHPLSPRSSLSSGSSFSQLDSNASPTTHPFDLERARHGVRYNSTRASQEMAQSEINMQSYRTILSNDNVYSGYRSPISPTNTTKEAEVELHGAVFQTSFEPRANFMNKPREEIDYSLCMWRIMLYLLVTNPFICGFNAFYTLFTIPSSIICTPFSSTTLSTNIITRLSRPLFFHFRMLHQNAEIPPTDHFKTMNLIMVHLFSPFVAMMLWTPSLCIGFGWLYGLLLSDDDVEMESLRDWVILKLEGYLLKALR